jgi:hypothetical protein
MDMFTNVRLQAAVQQQNGHIKEVLEELREQALLQIVLYQVVQQTLYRIK